MWFSASKSVESHRVGGQINFDSNQAMEPGFIHQGGMTQQADLTRLGGAPQINQAPLRRLLQIQGPALGKRAARRGRLHALRPALPTRRHKARRAFLQLGQGMMLKARPDLGLPPAIVVFDHGLEAGLSRRRKHRRHLQAQAKPCYPAHGVRKLMRTLKDRVVVELGVVRQAAFPPMRNDHFHRYFRGQGGLGPERVRPPWSETPLSTSTAVPPLITRPSTMSKLSNSAWRAATSGRYQPRGGGGRRTR